MARAYEGASQEPLAWLLSSLSRCPDTEMGNLGSSYGFAVWFESAPTRRIWD